MLLLIADMDFLNLCFMTGAVHGAALAVAAVARHGFSGALLFHHANDDRGDNANQHCANYYRPKIACKPLQHKLNSLFFG